MTQKRLCFQAFAGQEFFWKYFFYANNLKSFSGKNKFSVVYGKF